MEDSNTGTVKKNRGRPKGSKNKPKGKKTGRPKGSKSTYTMTEKALAQRREHTALFPARNPEEMEYNSRMIEHIMRINEIAMQADRHDLLSLKSCFIAYLRLCQEDGFKVGNLAAYSAMGMSKNDFSVMSKKDDPEIRKFCSFVRDTCSMFRETMVADNKINPVIGIFWQRNFDGLRNDTEQVQSANEQSDDELSSKAYKEKYKNLIGD